MADDFKQLNDIEHILLRPNMYAGSIELEKYDMFVSGKYCSIEMVPALIKCVNELIDNAIDEFIRTKGKYSTNIKITMTDKSFQIDDNGRGIPIEKYNDEWRPVLCWCSARAGTSFSENRDTVGANGVGSMICNVFSKKFIGITCDGKNKLTVTCEDNISKTNVSVRKFTTYTGTSVYCEPDFERFNITSFSENDIKIIESRINTLSYVFKDKINFIFNGKKIIYKKDNDFFSMFGENYEMFETGNKVKIVVYPSDTDDYSQYSVINALELNESGSIDTYIARELCSVLRETIKKKHKIECSIPEIKKGLKIVIIGDGFVDMKFSSQSKTKLTNSESEVKKFLGDIDFQKIAKKIFVNDDIIQPIIELKLARVEAAEKRANTLAQKKMMKKYVEKHLAAKSKNIEETTIFLTEGNSASGTGKKVRDIQKHGFYPMRGCAKNIYGLSDKAILENKELNDIMTILGLRFDMTKKEITENLNYGKIGILADADCYGKNTLIETNNGLKYIKDIFLDDKVLSSDGKYHNVIDVVTKKTKNVITFEIENDTITVSPYQKMFIVRDDKILNVYAKDVLLTDCLLKKRN